MLFPKSSLGKGLSHNRDRFLLHMLRKLNEGGKLKLLPLLAPQLFSNLAQISSPGPRKLINPPEDLSLPLGYFLHGKSSRTKQLKLSKIYIHLLFLSRVSPLASPSLTPGRSINQLHSDSAALPMLIMHLAAGGKHHLWCQVH